ncbi:MAG TPA: hypothetical protein VJB96_02140 [Patescibacteria group bacterium]|nr:hypothetical protein [Patescibacteria group bacterium]
MPNPGSILDKIGESFETIGSDVVKQTIAAPKDIAQAAAESLGLSGGKKNPKQQQTVKASQTPLTPEQQEVQQKSEEEKRAVARAALEELIGKKPQKKEPTVWEKIQQEEEQKKELEKKRKVEAAKQALPQVKSKRPRGDLYGMKAKKASAEMSRNVRQD